MKQIKVPFWNSLVSRVGLVFMGLTILAIFVSGYFLYQEASKVIVSHNQERIQHTSTLAKEIFYDLLRVVSNDIAVMTENPLVSSYIEVPSQTNLENIQQLFHVLLTNKSNYFQVRLLDEDNDGKEIIRYDKSGKLAQQIADSLLQYKGRTSYYQGAMSTGRGQYYFSEINLNEEFGVVSVPHTPTLRAVGKIYNDMGELQALLVINVDLTSYYHKLEGLMATGTQLLITNRQDEYLFAPEKSKCFGEQLGTGHSLRNDFNLNTWHLIAAAPDFSFMRDKEGVSYLYNVEKLAYARGQEIYLITLMERADLFASAHLVRTHSLQILCGICVVLLLFFVLLMRLLTRRIGEVTAAITGYERVGLSRSTRILLPETRKDEIGVLARSFGQMRERIDRQVQELKMALESEKQAITARDEFLQNMSHELRTPLNAILGLSQLLKKNNPRPEQEPIVDSLRRSASNLSDLMYDVLDHQKLMEGKVSVKMSSQNIAEILDDIYASYQYDALNKKLAFELMVDESLHGQYYMTDSLRIKQIVTNLVVNAIKYTEEGYVRLVAEYTDGALKVAVSDSGVGIQLENLKRIQDRFYREDGVGTQRSEGFGLGLSIVKHLLDLFGGELRVRSELGEGSTFEVLIPMSQVESDSSVSSEELVVSMLPQLDGVYTVLHLEDDESALLLVKSALDRPDLSVVQVTSIASALEEMKASHPALVLSDMMLGSHALDDDIAQLRQQYPDTPVVLLSAFEMERMMCLSPWAIQKPIDLDQLLDMVYTRLGETIYGLPELASSYAQYDNEPVLIDRFLTLLTQEFETYILRITEAYRTQNQKGWEAIHHKLVTHIKKQNLSGLSGAMLMSVVEMSDERLALVVNHLRYYLCCYRVELLTNSVN
ncbi:response regulator [Gilvimarinus agarilyticus]|uniref:ATP-binding protein n=1 Tax=Reichenbachiella agariperforans TaxID=156994 RepID=UPI001C09B044|nr:ATP-binding protein [Reichenbachiella agariperforans]MBU2887951.1 response regulator [Gilvimarinus agarilyticus]MBU2913399.1 response regulator [Reichenbachiella agariperforans]